jgi:hypothetical protein
MRRVIGSDYDDDSNAAQTEDQVIRRRADRAILISTGYHPARRTRV